MKETDPVFWFKNIYLILLMLGGKYNYKLRFIIYIWFDFEPLKTFFICIFRNINNSQKNHPEEEISGYVLNENTTVQEIKVFKSKEIKPEQDMSPYGLSVCQSEFSI